jgi:hypothetical protein
VSFETNQWQNIRHFKTNVWIRVGFRKEILKVAKEIMGICLSHLKACN